MTRLSQRTVSRSHGFSLIELMISMVIGLILLAGVTTVFISAQQTSQTKRDLENAQEALRYAHQSISRIVRVGSIDDVSDSDTLIIRLNRNLATPDCLGETDEDEVEVEYSLNGLLLECLVEGARGVIARNITDFGLQYQALDGNAWTGTSSTDAVSVRVNVEFDDFVDTSFVATSRAQVLDAIQ